MYCINCGEKILEGAKFCIRCGTKVVTDLSVTSAPQPGTTQAPTPPTDNTQPSTQPPVIPTGIPQPPVQPPIAGAEAPQPSIQQQEPLRISKKQSSPMTTEDRWTGQNDMPVKE